MLGWDYFLPLEGCSLLCTVSLTGISSFAFCHFLRLDLRVFFLFCCFPGMTVNLLPPSPKPTPHCLLCGNGAGGGWRGGSRGLSPWGWVSRGSWGRISVAFSSLYRCLQWGPVSAQGPSCMGLYLSSGAVLLLICTIPAFFKVVFISATQSPRTPIPCYG